MTSSVYTEAIDRLQPGGTHSLPMVAQSSLPDNPFQRESGYPCQSPSSPLVLRDSTTSPTRQTSGDSTSTRVSPFRAAIDSLVTRGLLGIEDDVASAPMMHLSHHRMNLSQIRLHRLKVLNAISLPLRILLLTPLKLLLDLSKPSFQSGLNVKRRKTLLPFRRGSSPIGVHFFL